MSKLRDVTEQAREYAAFTPFEEGRLARFFDRFDKAMAPIRFLPDPESGDE